MTLAPVLTAEPVIVVSNQTFLQDGRQFEYTESRHTLDKFYFSAVARRSPAHVTHSDVRYTGSAPLLSESPMLGVRFSRKVNA